MFLYCFITRSFFYSASASVRVEDTRKQPTWREVEFGSISMMSTTIIDNNICSGGNTRGDENDLSRVWKFAFDVTVLGDFQVKLNEQ